MVDFMSLPLGGRLWDLLSELNIDFAFQPIYRRETMAVAGYEALMRPMGATPVELIEEHRRRGSLHTLELATFIGATKTFLESRLPGFISVNSFPSECFTPEESGIYFRCFPNMAARFYVEILEYTDLDLDRWITKKGQIRSHDMKVALDDYGSGNNFMMAVNIFDPDVIKIDRALIAGIQEDEDKQRHLDRLIDRFHRRGCEVLAEGIELREELDYLCGRSVDYLQGFYLGRPKIFRPAS